MERKIVEVKEKNTSNKQEKKVDLKKVAKVISENKETIAVVATAVGTIISASNGNTTTRKTTTKRKTTRAKKSTSTKRKKSSSNDTISTLVDMFLK